MLLASVHTVNAASYNFVDWTAADAKAGTASGTLTLSDSSTVSVAFSVTNGDGTPGSFYFAQTDGGGLDYWSVDAPYISAQVDNAPDSSDILALVGGGANTRYTLTLSRAIDDPILDVLSLGRDRVFVSYEFDTPFTILSSGTGYFGGSADRLQQLPGNVLVGEEGHGTLGFTGSFTSLSWVAPSPEVWHGFQLGVRGAEPVTLIASIPEPGSYALFGLGLAALAVAGRRRR